MKFPIRSPRHAALVAAIVACAVLALLLLASRPAHGSSVNVTAPRVSAVAGGSGGVHRVPETGPGSPLGAATHPQEPVAGSLPATPRTEAQ